MDKAEFNMHIRAGLAYGQEGTCGKKQDFKSEETAFRVAPKLSAKFGHEMEAYPCAFCNGWHVGREMTAEERKQFMVTEQATPRHERALSQDTQLFLMDVVGLLIREGDVFRRYDVPGRVWRLLDDAGKEELWIKAEQDFEMDKT